MKGFRAIVAGVLVTCSAMTANAVEFRNFDNRNHKVKITSPSMNKDVEFRAMTRSLVICVDKCKFNVKGVGTVTATRDDVVTISEGKVTTTRAATFK